MFGSSTRDRKRLVVAPVHVLEINPDETPRASLSLCLMTHRMPTRVALQRATGMVVCTATELRRSLLDVFQKIQRRPVLITVRGRPQAVLQKFTDLDLEATAFVRRPSTRRAIRRALTQAVKGQGVDVEALVKELGPRRGDTP